MAIRAGKTRIMVTFPDALLQKMDTYCEKAGLNRSSYLCYLASTNLYAQEKLLEGVIDRFPEMVKGSAE